MFTSSCRSLHSAWVASSQVRQRFFALGSAHCPKVIQLFISLQISDLQKELWRTLTNFEIIRDVKFRCSIFASCLGGERSLKCCTMLTMDNGGWWRQWGGCWPKGVRLFGVGGAWKKRRANLTIRSSVVAPTGIEPVFHAWEACVLADRRKRQVAKRKLLRGSWGIRTPGTVTRTSV